MKDFRVPCAGIVLSALLCAGSAWAQGSAAPARADAPPYAYSYAYPPPARLQPPPFLPYHDGEAVPPGYTLESSPHRALMIAGSLVFAIPYVSGLLIATGSQFRNQSGWLALPVAGPVFTLARRTNACAGFGDCFTVFWVDTFLGLDGVAQTTGAVLFVLGVAWRKKRFVRNDVTRIEILPTSVGSGYGVSALGTF